MWVGLCLALASVRGALGDSGGLRAENSTVNWSTGIDPYAPRPTTWTLAPAVVETAANGTDGGQGNAELPLTCKGEHDCPPWSHCEEQAGRNSCRCGLGYHLLPTLGCVPVKAFPAQLLLLPPHPSDPLGWWIPEGPEPREPQVATLVQSLFHHILGHLDGYLGTSTEEVKWPSLEVTVIHLFSVWVPVTTQKVEGAMVAFQAQCQDRSPKSRAPACAFLHHVGTYQSLNLCDFGPCDSASTFCSFQDGLIQCACQPGYLQAHPMDRTCAACSSGFWLQDGTCARCPFGFSGPGCQEPLLLALVLVSCFCGLLLVLLLFTAAACLPGRARPCQEPPSPLQFPLHSPTLSLPRVRPPWTVREDEGPQEGSRPTPLPPWDPEGDPRLAADTPSMKTFLGSPRTPPSAAAPLPLQGTSNLVFVGDGEEGGKRSHFRTFWRGGPSSLPLG